MPIRRARPLVVAAVVLAVLAPCVPAGAEPSNPTPEEIRRANERVAAAARRVATLQERAGHAVEAYNGALVAAKRAAGVAATEARLAAEAQEAYEGVKSQADAAEAVADAARARVAAAEAAQQAAQAEADEAQRVLDRIAVGAFQTDGQLGMVSQLFLAEDPLELASARHLMNRLGVYQDKAIKAAVAARARAQAAAETAAQAVEDASAAEDMALQALSRATAARDKARASELSAERAASDARESTRTAERAKETALALVARAEAVLGSARKTKAQLEAAARAARNEASKHHDVSAPNDRARTAIDAAFDQIGVPYSWGGGDENGPTYGFAQGAGTKGFDCSGLTLYAYAQAGVRLDHYSQAQWDRGPRVKGELLPGDLLYFAFDTSDPSTIHHVALYIGKGKMIEAPYTGEVVRVASSHRSDYIGATRPWA